MTTDRWRLFDVPDRAVALAKTASELASRVRSLGNLPDGVADIRYDVINDTVELNCFESCDKSAASDLARQLAGELNHRIDITCGALEPEDPVVKLAAASEAQRIRQKQATSPMLRGMAELAHIVPGRRNWLPGGANPLTSTLAGGILGAASGYGIGAAGEYLLPAQWERGKLRRTLAALGAGIGAAPGLTIGATNLGRGLNFTDGRVQNHPDDVLAKAAAYAEFLKKSWGDQTGLELARDALTPSFNPDYAMEQIWQQPLPTYTRAALTGLTSGAQQHAERSTGRTTLVTPLDVARMTAGMGTGYLSGMLVGKALGTMFGAPPQTQKTLQQTGMMAGVLANLVPIAFRGTGQ